MRVCVWRPLGKGENRPNSEIKAGWHWQRAYMLHQLPNWEEAIFPAQQGTALNSLFQVKIFKEANNLQDICDAKPTPKSE